MFHAMHHAAPLRRLALAAALALALPATATDCVWTTGGIADDGRPAAITINDTLRIGCLAGHACGTPYANNNFLNNGTVYATQSVYFVTTSHTIDHVGTLNLPGDVGLLNAAYGGTLLNSGVINKTAGSGEASLAGMNLANTGTINVQSGRCAGLRTSATKAC